MRYSIYFVLAAALGCGSLLAQTKDPFAAWQHFSATVTGGPVVRDPLKIYRSGNQLRADHEDQVHITNLDDLSSVVISNNKCIQMPMPDGPSYPFSAHKSYEGFKFERLPVEGEETIDGHKCKMETLIYTQEPAGVITIRMKLWEAQDLDGFPIQIDVLPTVRKKPFTYHFSDVSVGPQDPKLFTKPAQCPTFGAVEPSAAPHKKPLRQKANPAAKPPQE
jgi:hypothetical protein